MSAGMMGDLGRIDIEIDRLYELLETVEGQIAEIGEKATRDRHARDLAYNQAYLTAEGERDENGKKHSVEHLKAAAFVASADEQLAAELSEKTESVLRLRFRRIETQCDLLRSGKSALKVVV